MALTLDAGLGSPGSIAAVLPTSENFVFLLSCVFLYMFSDFLVAVSNNCMENIERDRSQSTEMLPEVANVIIGDIGYTKFCRNILVFFWQTRSFIFVPFRFSATSLT